MDDWSSIYDHLWSLGRVVARSVARSVTRSVDCTVDPSLARCSPARSLLRSPARSLARSLARSFTRSLTRSLTRSIYFKGSKFELQLFFRIIWGFEFRITGVHHIYFARLRISKYFRKALRSNIFIVSVSIENKSSKHGIQTRNMQYLLFNNDVSDFIFNIQHILKAIQQISNRVKHVVATPDIV